MNENITGKPSIDRPWMKYYPEMIKNLRIPECTLREYLDANCRGRELTAIHYYGEDISWNTVFKNVDAVARSLRAIGFKENDQIPVFLRSVPEFVYLLLAAEKIGASLLCRDNTLMENVEAVAKSGAKAIIAHDYLRQHELEAYLAATDVEKVVLLDPCYSGRYEKMPPHVFSHFVKCSLSLDSGSHEDMPEHIRNSVDKCYGRSPAHGDAVMTWDEFLDAGRMYFGQVAAAPDINRPLLRAYTSGSTGPSKQVIHSANTIISVVHQMNFYASADEYRTTWLLTILPPALIAVVVSMIIMPLASNRILIMDPFCEPEDVDLELMRYRPNAWPIIPMFIDTVMKNGRVPDDYDMSHLLASGVGCESYNNKQIKTAQEYLHNHNCNVTFTVGYGCSEAGSNVTLPVTSRMFSDGNVGIPMPKTVISIFKPGTEEELTYNEHGEICISGPGLMLGYDDPESTARALRKHKDGRIWLHTGDIGFMEPDGNLHTLTRGKAPRFGGGDLATLPMENLVADANIEGIRDEFFVVVPDDENPGYFLPYMYVMLEEGYTVADVAIQIRRCLKPHMQPIEIVELTERPFFHFKTNRLGLQRELVTRRLENIEEERYA